MCIRFLPFLFFPHLFNFFDAYRCIFSTKYGKNWFYYKKELVFFSHSWKINFEQKIILLVQNSITKFRKKTTSELDGFLVVLTTRFFHIWFFPNNPLSLLLLLKNTADSFEFVWFFNSNNKDNNNNARVVAPITLSTISIFLSSTLRNWSLSALLHLAVNQLVYSMLTNIYSHLLYTLIQ